jgi:hypothetical protein
MASRVETHGAIILHDGIAIGQSHDTLAFLLRYQGQSASYALEHGGYAIEERDNIVRGWMAFLTIAGRRGYGVEGAVVRSIVEVQALTNSGDLANDYHLAGGMIASMLHGIIRGLDYLAGDLATIAAELDTWARATATRWGLDPENV